MAHFLWGYLTMKMRVALFLLTVTFLTTVFGCKKDEKVEIPSEFPVRLLAERWELRAETRLFTDRKEIKDADVIRRFEEKENLKDLFETSVISPDPESGLVFTSELAATFSLKHDSGNGYDVERKGTRFLFYSTGNYLVNPSAPPSAGSLGYLHAMLKYSDVLGVPLPNGLRATREVRVAYGNYKVLKLSAFSYALNIHRSASGGLSADQFKGVLFNEFDVNVAKFMTATDTLAVREYSLICTLRK